MADHQRTLNYRVHLDKSKILAYVIMRKSFNVMLIAVGALTYVITRKTSHAFLAMGTTGLAWLAWLKTHPAYAIASKAQIDAVEENEDIPLDLLSKPIVLPDNPTLDAIARFQSEGKLYRMARQPSKQLLYDRRVPVPHRARYNI